MAKMIPSTVRDFHESRGEEKVFFALRSLPDSITVIHSFRWLHPGKHRKVLAKVGPQGEGDFIVFDPSRGLMVIEVKGGEIWCERGEWRQRNRRTGAVRAIWPETQASNTCHRIREELQARLPEATSLLFCHAVWFPEGMPDREKLPMNCPSEIVLDEEDIGHPERAIGRAFSYWGNAFPGRGGVSDNDARRVLESLAPTFSLVPSVQRSIEERDAQLVQLTREQARIIDFLDEQRHAAVHGAAGTGKTLLAIEKARRLATLDDPVLFLCYNRALKEHLQQEHSCPNVHYATFHGLARETFGPVSSLEDVEQALLSHLMQDRPLPYSHLIVDEAQDFKTDWLEFLSHYFREMTFYVFYDRNQLVQEGDLAWLEAVPCRLILSRNCRNTNEVARVAYRAGGLTVSPTLGVSGPRPVLHTVQTDASAAQLTSKLLAAARKKTRAAPCDLAVLTMNPLSATNPLRGIRLPGLQFASRPAVGRVTMTTVRRFKGLEARLVIVPDVDFRRANDSGWRRRLYVACSRARQAVHLITTVPEKEIGAAVQAFAGTDRARPKWRTIARLLGATLGNGGRDDPFH